MNKRNQTNALRRGFTLVEVLTVIVIIGILAAISVPAIGIAMRTAKRAAIRLEIDVLSQSLEAYKLEYGEYPPDFYDWNQVERHFRKAFPNINDNELRILAQFTHYDSNMNRCNAGGPADPRTSTAFDHYPHAIDRAEALVFCLGGFSSDDKRPFTGTGGPLAKRTDASFATEPDDDNDDFLAFQYNTDREIGFFDFKIPQLSLVLIDDGTVRPFTYSGDETPTVAAASQINDPKSDNQLSSTGNPPGVVYYPDPFPTYRDGNSQLPIVYFSAKNYDKAWGIEPPTAVWNNGSRNAHFQNLYIPNGEISETGIARPYATENVDTTPPSTISGLSVFPDPRVRILQFAEPNRFQLLSPGLDGNYGALVGTGYGSGTAGVAVFPTGRYYNPFVDPDNVIGTDKYQDDLEAGTSNYNAQPQLDNITNFSTSDLESDLP